MRKWHLWGPMLAAPVLALSEQSVVYALATPLCQRQAGGWIHAVFLLFLGIAIVLTLGGRSEVRRLEAAYRGSVAPDTDRHQPQWLFLARVATWTGALSSVVLLAMWVPQWLLSPCQG
jgi:hypothetical protein